MRLISALRGLALLLLASLGLVACAELAPSTTARTRIAEVALERGDYPRAVDEYRQVAEASRDAKKSEHAARVAFEHSQFSALAAIARGWLSRDPHNELAHRFLAVASLELDDRVGAERELEVLVHTAYVSPGDAFDALAESLADLHNAVGVAATMRHLAEAYPALPQANLAAASLLLAAGQATDARR